MSVKSGQAITVLFTTSHPTTGAATDGDSPPVGTLYVNGTADAAEVTETKLSTGVYTAAVTLPALSAGDVVTIGVTATVNSVAGAGIVWQEVADTYRTSDIEALVDDLETNLATTDGKADQIIAAVITNAAGTDIAADIIALKTVADTIQADTDLLDDAAGGIADIHTDLGTLTTTVGAAGAGLTAITGVKLHADYDAAKTAAQAGAKMDLVDAPNATAVTAIQAGLSTYNGTDTAGTTTLLARLSAVWAAQLDAAVSTRLAAADYTAPDNAGIADIPTNAEFTNALAALNDFDPSTDKVDLVDAPNATALVAMAVALLDTLLSEGDADALNARTVRSALRAIRNKSGTVGGTLTVCKEDDTAAAWTAAVTEDASAEPITEIDPA